MSFCHATVYVAAAFHGTAICDGELSDVGKNRRAEAYCQSCGNTAITSAAAHEKKTCITGFDRLLDTSGVALDHTAFGAISKPEYLFGTGAQCFSLKFAAKDNDGGMLRKRVAAGAQTG